MTTTVQFEGHPLTLHDWDNWVPPGPAVTGPAMTWADNTTMALHYTAAVNLIDGDLGEFQYNIPPYLRAIHLDYLLHRPQANGATGYSIGYNWAVDWLGGIWRLRGWDIKCAANKGWNDQTFACLCLVDGADPLTDEALRSVRYLHWKGEQLAGHELVQRPHSQLKSDGTLMPFPGTVTGCPGNGIRNQLRVGSTNWRYLPPAPAPNPPEDDMANPVKYLRVHVPGDPTRAEALVLLAVQGFNSDDERATVTGFHDATDRPVSAAQYDALLAIYRV